MSPEEPVYCPTNSQDESIKVGNPGAPVMIVRGPVEHSKLLPWLMLCAILAGFSLAMSVACGVCTFWLAHEYHVLQILLQDHDALLIREGLKQPADIAKGPTGNLEFKERH